MAAANAVPRTLNATQHGYKTHNINGQGVMMYNSPIETAKTLIAKQGNNQRDMGGTCGLCQCANILRLAGIEVSEDDVINIAIACGGRTAKDLEMENTNPDMRGGTSSGARQEILERFHLMTYIQPISAVDRQSTVGKFANAVSTGHGVIVSVDAGILWNIPSAIGGAHAISLLSVSDRGDMFIYQDTAYGRLGVISAIDLSRALTGNPANITCDVIR